MSALHDPNKNKIFIGRCYLGKFNEKSLVVTTFGNDVYLQIIDRPKGIRVILTPKEFFEILKHKDKICSFLDKGAQIVGKQVNERLENEFTIVKSKSSDTDTEHDMSKLVNKITMKIKKECIYIYIT